MTKITALPSDSSPTGDDYTVSVDTTSGQTKKVLLSDLLSYVNNNTVPLMTNASNPYKFFVYANATQNLAAGPTKMPFDAELFDTNNNFASNKYTVPVTGFYSLFAQIYVQALADQAVMAVYIYVNGTNKLRGVITSSGTNDQSASVGGLLNLTAGDYLEVFAYNTQGTRNYLGRTASGADYLTYFCGHLVSAT